MSISIYSPTLQMSTKGGGGLLAATETEDGAIQIFGAVQSFLARGGPSAVEVKYFLSRSNRSALHGTFMQTSEYVPRR